MFLERIERIDPQLNAFRVVWRDEALAAADEADQRIAAGEEAPLLGVPIAIKDTVDVAGDVTMLGTDGFDRPAERTRRSWPACARPARCILGKTNLPELAIHGFTESQDPRRHPQPLEHRAHDGRLQRRQRRRRRRRAWRRSPTPPTAPARSATRPPTAACSA